jgi:hypothetical protein
MKASSRAITLPQTAPSPISAFSLKPRHFLLAMVSLLMLMFAGSHVQAAEGKHAIAPCAALNAGVTNDM